MWWNIIEVAFCVKNIILIVVWFIIGNKEPKIENSDLLS